MTFDEILAQIIDLLKRQGRAPYTYCILLFYPCLRHVTSWCINRFP